MINPNWAKWVKASTATYFTQTLAPLILYIEGAARDTSNVDEYCELRMVGPNLSPETLGRWELQAAVNILVCTKTNDDANAYEHDITIGRVLSAFSEYPILDDNSDSIGCFQIESANRIRVTAGGILNTNVPMLQSSVEAMYKIYLEE